MPGRALTEPLALLEKTFQCRDVSLVFLTPHHPLEIKHVTQADKWQAVNNIRLRDLLGDRGLPRLSWLTERACTEDLNIP